MIETIVAMHAPMVIQMDRDAVMMDVAATRKKWLLIGTTGATCSWSVRSWQLGLT